jgi:hypothetical protein
VRFACGQAIAPAGLAGGDRMRIPIVIAGRGVRGCWDVTGQSKEARDGGDQGYGHQALSLPPPF